MNTSTVDSQPVRKSILDTFFLGKVQRYAGTKGSAFPRILGPKPREKVCIVGAGPAGLHMALELKQRNYTNIVILERSNRVGGKSFDFLYKGLNHPLGTIFAIEEYFDNVIPLARSYGVGDLVNFVRANIIDNYKRLELVEYIGRGPNSLLLSYLDAIRYINLHKDLFGTYQGELMPRPSTAVLYRIRGTFLDFLKRENLLGLVPLFKLSQTLQGYGYLDEVAAFYGLMWNTPRLMTVHFVRTGDHDLFIFREGYQKIWETIQQTENFNIIFNTKLEKIVRRYKGMDLYTNHGVEKCDWLVWTPPVNDLLTTLESPKYKEKELLSGQTHHTFTGNLINQRNYIEGPYNVYVANLDGKTERGVIADCDRSALLNPEIYTEAGLEKYKQEHREKERTLISLQLSREECSQIECNLALTQHYRNLTGQDPDIVHTVSFTPYFPRWTSTELTQGRLWDIFSLQGKHRTWYAGSSVCYESIKSVMEYNKLILRQMRY